MSEQNIEIGIRIHNLRKAHKLTQEALAEKLDVTVKHISAVERGLSSLSMDKFIQLCKIFDCNLDYLVRGAASSDDAAFFPASMIDIFHSNNKREIAMLNDYLQMYLKMRETFKR